jgi:hypothetical protein
MSKELTIGSKIFVVHNSYAYKNKSGARVVQARVTAFVNKNGIVEPEFRIIGSNGNTPDASPSCYHWFTNIKEAIDAIETKIQA